MPIQLVFLRHATWSAFGLNDSPLSAVGMSQAQELPETLRRSLKLENLEPIEKIICSPKLRARQTVLPLSQHLAKPLEIESRLDERHEGESSNDFDARVKAVLSEMTNEAQDASADKVIILCSHMDWLELAMVLAPSTLSPMEAAWSWQPAEFRSFEISSEPNSAWLLKHRGTVAPKESRF